MPCPICNHTMQNLGVEGERKFWCPRCGALKTMIFTGFEEWQAPYWISRIHAGQVDQTVRDMVDRMAAVQTGTGRE